jgi:hypothetical protein
VGPLLAENQSRQGAKNLSKKHVRVGGRHRLNPLIASAIDGTAAIYEVGSTARRMTGNGRRRKTGDFGWLAA